MLSPIPESKSKRSAELAEQMRLSCVKVTKVAGYEPVPRPARIEPDPAIAKLRDMAGRYTARDAAMNLGRTVAEVIVLAKRHGFALRKDEARA